MVTMMMMILKTTFYGEDPQGQAPFKESDNNVDVFPAKVPNINTDDLTTYLSNAVDPLQKSSSFGVDIFARALEIIVQRLEL